MKRIAFVFPGQGSQYAGMGKDFYDNDENCRQVIDQAAEISGFALQKIMFEEDERLNVTKYTQIAMLAVEAAILKKLENDGVKASVAAGLSLGEYGALLAAKAISYEDAFHLVTERGRLMQEAVPNGGAMSAIMGMDADKIEMMLGKIDGIVSIANFNCPGQIVITGEEDAVNKASKTLKENGAKKCIPLKVSGPFHSVMMEEAANKLSGELEKVKFEKPQIPYVSNVTASYVTNENDIPKLLKSQISSSVRWQQSVELMIKDGVDAFVEIGPKRSLSGFLKKIDRDAVGYHIEDMKSYEETIEKLGQ